ncbi:GGDEF domain-containing protein [Desulfosudis oleivorans]|uniref:diguanylate cyclase n=1 Tax=Desulfosudis oleivorans (strain DSM 6200 / JCM 39069 / Hxd3) TaxID=96561 RepID=A8ZZF1_DESOH|nr:GGDEF domain-containing protein [Desulfosudis oleivorans]ABW67304.1 diguanylate cyclase [Desulfosudis oleivorans Hxd3]
MISVFQKGDTRQALRIRRTLMAVASYLFIGAGCYLGVHLGYARDLELSVILIITTGVSGIYLIILTMMYKGINERFRDPSLTLFQILCGIMFITLIAYYMVDRIRGTASVLYILAFMFGTFRLRLKDLLVLTGITGGLYAGAMALLHSSDPGAVDPQLEVMRWVILMMALVWVSYMANYISKLRRHITRLATHDALTGVLSRREIFEVLGREKAFSDRAGTPFSLCMLDLDDFKQMNDTYGHQAGDAVLQSFARALKDNTRATDYVGRYGGEEFMVVFSNFQCLDSRASGVQRLLAATRNICLPDISPDLRITTSIGIAAYQPGESPDALLARADAALYEAKENGKDRAVFKEPGTD